MEKNNQSQASWSDFLKKKRANGTNGEQQEETAVIKFNIEGMTCPSCEALIEETLKEQEGVLKARVSYGAGTAEIEIDTRIIDNRARKDAFINGLIKIIKKLGYKASIPALDVGSKSKTKPEGFTPLQLAGIAVIITAVWLILDKTGVFNAIPEINQNMSYGLLFIVGLLTSLHCIAMCGGINLSQSVSPVGTDEEKMTKRLLPGFLYNLGRLISYTIIGGIVGAIGSVVSITGRAQGIVVIVAGTFMVVMGINMLNIFPWLRKFTPRLPKAFTQKVAGVRANKGPLIVGLLNGFMPCGPLQSMQLYALGTGSFIAGASSMFLFALGTIPLMFGLGAVSTFLTKKFTSRMMKISAILVLLLGVGMVNRGVSLTGWNINFAPVDNGNIAVLKADYQEVSSRVFSNRYEPIIVQSGIPVRWTINVDGDQLNGCNNPITLPSLGIKKKLVPGENIIEFTPASSGNLTYTCWMGMITSTVKVVDDLNQVSSEDLAKAEELSVTSRGSCCSSGGASSGGGCCGGGSGTPAPDSGSGFLLPQNDAVPKIEIPADRIGYSQITDSGQTLRIEITENGFSPAVSVLKRGVPTKLDFNGVTLNDDNYRILVPSYNARFQLNEGENLVEFTPEIDFYFNNWTNLFYGAVIVVDDIDNVDEKAIEAKIDELERIISLPAPSGGGGCCG